MSIETRLELSYYREIAELNQAHGVFLVQHITTKKICVKKVLTIYDLSVYRSLRDEPVRGVPRILLLHEEEGELTVIEEYISGTTVGERLAESGAFSQDEAIRCMRELCNILSALHRRKPAIIHRDIKPSNVLLDPNGHVFLLDFNAARQEVEKASDTRLLGTPGYAAPEQYGFGSSTVRTDIYALGMLLKTMLTDDAGKTEPSARMAKIIDRCTRLKPEERYGSAAELKMKLSRGGCIGRIPNYPGRSWFPPGFRSGNWLHMLAALIGYMLIGSLAFDLGVKDAGAAQLLLIRIIVLAVCLTVVACLFNYLNLQRLMPLCAHKSPVVRILGVILLCICAAAAELLLICTAAGLFFA